MSPKRLGTPRRSEFLLALLLLSGPGAWSEEGTITLGQLCSHNDGAGRLEASVEWKYAPYEVIQVRRGPVLLKVDWHIRDSTPMRVLTARLSAEASDLPSRTPIAPRFEQRWGENEPARSTCNKADAFTVSLGEATPGFVRVVGLRGFASAAAKLSPPVEYVVETRVVLVCPQAIGATTPKHLSSHLASMYGAVCNDALILTALQRAAAGESEATAALQTALTFDPEPAVFGGEPWNTARSLALKEVAVLLSGGQNQTVTDSSVPRWSRREYERGRAAVVKAATASSRDKPPVLAADCRAALSAAQHQLTVCDEALREALDANTRERLRERLEKVVRSHQELAASFEEIAAVLQSAGGIAAPVAAYFRDFRKPAIGGDLEVLATPLQATRPPPASAAQKSQSASSAGPRAGPGAGPAAGSTHPPPTESGTEVVALRNGDFRSGLAGWEVWQRTSARGVAAAEVVRGDNAHPLVLELKRAKAGMIFGAVTVSQAVRVRPSASGVLRVEATLRVMEQSLKNPGATSLDYPLILQLLYLDPAGTKRTWRHAFYLGVASASEEEATRAEPGLWLHFQSRNLSELAGGLREVIEVKLLACGWDFQTQVDEVSLVTDQ